MSAEWFEEKEVVDKDGLHEARRSLAKAEELYRAALHAKDADEVDIARVAYRTAVMDVLFELRDDGFLSPIIDVSELAKVVYDVIDSRAISKIIAYIGVLNKNIIRKSEAIDAARRELLSATERYEKAKIECRLPSR